MDVSLKLLRDMIPQDAAKTIAMAAREIFPLLDEKERRDVITQMLGDSEGDKVVGLVHL